MRRRHVGQRAWNTAQLASWERIGLVSHWCGGTGSGLTLPDSSGMGNEGVFYSGTGFSLGRDSIRNAMSFDGTTASARIAMPNSPILTTSANPFTASCWVYLKAFVDQYPIAMGLNTDGSTRAWILAASNQASYLGVHFGCESGWARRKSDTAASEMVDRWRHLAVTYEGGNLADSSKFILYIDGVETTTTAAGAFGAIPNGTSLGSSYDGGASKWNGIIDDARVYSRMLSGAEVAALASPSRRIVATGRRASGTSSAAFSVAPTGIIGAA